MGVPQAFRKWAYSMNKKGSLGAINPSICEAAFAEYAMLDDSLAKLIQKNSIEIREFIVLAYVYNQGVLSTGQIAQILGMSLTNTESCIDRLIGADLIQYSDGKDGSETDRLIQLTSAGRVLTSRVLDSQD
jgi:DNA-binding MarR family transcriptional regulator